MTIDDGLNLKRIDEVAISPDGNSVVYSVSILDWEENEHTNEYFLYRDSTGDTRDFIGEAGGEDFQFSPDGRQVAFCVNLIRTTARREKVRPENHRFT